MILAIIAHLRSGERQCRSGWLRNRAGTAPTRRPSRPPPVLQALRSAAALAAGADLGRADSGHRRSASMTMRARAGADHRFARHQQRRLAVAAERTCANMPGRSLPPRLASSIRTVSVWLSACAVGRIAMTRPPKLSPGNAASVALAPWPTAPAPACASGTAALSQTVPMPLTCARRLPRRQGHARAHVERLDHAADRRA
jgi:hypothetical protein